MCAAGVFALTGAEELDRFETGIASTSAMFSPPNWYSSTWAWKRFLALLAGGFDGGHDAQLGVDDAGAVAGGAGASELELKSAGFTPLAFANALRIGSSSPVYVAGLLRREPRIGGLVDRHHLRPGRTPSRGSASLARARHLR